jgi:hypothetical protein
MNFDLDRIDHGRHRGDRHVARVGSCLLFLLVFAGCDMIRGQQGMLENNVKGAKISTRQLGFSMNDFIARFADQVEESADRISAGTKDASVKRNALLWKIHGIPACFHAALRDDAYVAYFDLAVLCRQMVQFFDGGAGREVFGDQQPIAIGTSRSLLDEMNVIADTFAPSPEFVREDQALMQSFVEKEPIQSLQFARASVIRMYVEKVQPRVEPFFDAVGSLAESISASQELVTLYSAEIPKLFRWQLELFAIDAQENRGIPMAVPGLESSVERAVQIVGETPKLIQDERAAVVTALHQERVESLTEIDAMRRATLETVEQERAAVVGAMRTILDAERDVAMKQFGAEREAAGKQLGAEREIMMKRVGEERAIALKELDAISQRRMVDAHGRGVDLIDHAFARALEFLAVAAIAGVAMSIVWHRRRARPTDRA